MSSLKCYLFATVCVTLLEFRLLFTSCLLILVIPAAFSRSCNNNLQRWWLRGSFCYRVVRCGWLPVFNRFLGNSRSTWLRTLMTIMYDVGRIKCFSNQNLGFRFCPGLQLNNYDDVEQPTLSGYNEKPAREDASWSGGFGEQFNWQSRLHLQLNALEEITLQACES